MPTDRRLGLSSSTNPVFGFARKNRHRLKKEEKATDRRKVNIINVIYTFVLLNGCVARKCYILLLMLLLFDVDETTTITIRCHFFFNWILQLGFKN